VSESGSGVDTSTLVAVITVTDADGTVIESATYRYFLAAVDTNGTTVENAVLVFFLVGSDSGSGADASSLAANIPTTTDTGSSSESGSFNASYAGAEGGTGVESSLLVVRLSGADSGSGIDSGIGGGAIFVFGTDTGSGSEAGTIIAKVAGSDSGASVDEISRILHQVFDSATGTDNAVFGGSKVSVVEVGSGSEDAITRAVIAALGESGIGVDSAVAFEKILKLVKQVLSANAPRGELLSAAQKAAKLRVTRDIEAELLEISENSGSLKSASEKDSGQLLKVT
jgi:hypothetical protein